MDQRTKETIWAYFSPETAGEEDALRKSLKTSAPEHRDPVKAGFAEVLRTRSLSVKEFYVITDTDLELETEDQVYAEIARAYEHLFEEPAPTFEGDAS